MAADRVDVAVVGAGFAGALALATILVSAACSDGSSEGLPGRASPTSVAVDTPTAIPIADLTEDDLARHGIYRIVPPGYTGERNHVSTGDPIDPGVSSNDPEVVRTSPLYVAIEGVPDDLELAEISTFDGGLNTVVYQVFRGEAGPRSLRVSRIRRFSDPIDIFVPNVLPGSIRGYDGISFESPDTVVPRARQAWLRFHQDGVDTLVAGFALPLSLVQEIAENIAMSVDEQGQEDR